MLQNFGTALSREQMKNVLGGNQPVDVIGDEPKCPLKCSDVDCTAHCKCFHAGTSNEYCGKRD